jgi:D-apionolactonase
MLANGDNQKFSKTIDMKPLYAGPITAGYENGFLRRISYGETEILRMIYFALRDHNWNTMDAQIENERITIEKNHFEIRYDCFHTNDGATVIQWKTLIAGMPDGTITFEIEGVAMQNFRKNRAGFCVLHPLNIIGEQCEITHPDESKSESNFPVNVSPHNPFTNIKSMSWAASGLRSIILFEGDIFETEDQRNWSDASFKTFCTPLDKPFPVELKAGERIFQRITFKPERTPEPARASAPHISLVESEADSVLPWIGIGASTEIKGLAEPAVSLIRALGLSHYRVDIFAGNENWVSAFSASYENAFSLSLPLEAALHLTSNYREEIGSFVALSQQNRVNLKKVLLLGTNGLVTGQALIDQVPQFKSAFPKVLFGAGTNYNFNEINKNHFSMGDLDYVSFSVDPQEHASDDLTVIENIASQEHLVKSAKAIYGENVQVHISPVTLRKRFNPYATNPADLFIEESKKADPRQKREFAAIWTFGALCSLAKGGASFVTFYQTMGNQGILPAHGDPYPVYRTFKSLSPYQGKPVNVLKSSDPLAVQAMVLDGKMLALANLTDEKRVVRFKKTEVKLSPMEMKFVPLNRTQKL